MLHARHDSSEKRIHERSRMITAKDFSSVGNRQPEPRPAPASRPVPQAPELAATMDDKSEIARLREALQRSEEFNQALLATVSDLIFELRKDGLILSLHAPKDNEF